MWNADDRWPPLEPLIDALLDAAPAERAALGERMSSGSALSAVAVRLTAHGAA